MNSVSGVFALKIPTSRREFKYTDAALIQQKSKKKQIEWNVGHFMHPMVTALLTLDEYIYIFPRLPMTLRWTRLLTNGKREH